MLRLAFVLSLLAAAPAAGQEAAPAPARAEDVASVDAIIRAVYDVISGPAGQPRNWDRMRSLFVPGARLIPTRRTPDGKRSTLVWTLEEYIATVGPRLTEMGFFEREIGRVQEQYGSIVHLMSAYDSKRKADDTQPFARGVNSFQLFNDGNRWWVVTIYWEQESPDTPIPARFLNQP